MNGVIFKIENTYSEKKLNKLELIFFILTRVLSIIQIRLEVSVFNVKFTAFYLIITNTFTVGTYNKKPILKV